MINQAGLDLLRHFEGLRLEKYNDAAGLPTIGIGHLIRPGENFDSQITLDQAEKLLQDDLQHTCNGVFSCLNIIVNDNQFAALVCFAYNIGVHAFCTSTLLKYVNKVDFSNAAKEFKKWNKAGGKVLAGLSARRDAEANLFTTPVS